MGHGSGAFSCRKDDSAPPILTAQDPLPPTPHDPQELVTKSTLTSLSWVTESPSRVTKSACQGTKRGTRTPSRITKSLSQGTKMGH